MLLSRESLNWAERVERGTGGSFVFLVLFDLILFSFILFLLQPRLRYAVSGQPKGASAKLTRNPD